MLHSCLAVCGAICCMHVCYAIIYCIHVWLYVMCMCVFFVCGAHRHYLSTLFESVIVQGSWHVPPSYIPGVPGPRMLVEDIEANYIHSPSWRADWPALVMTGKGSIVWLPCPPVRCRVGGRPLHTTKQPLSRVSFRGAWRLLGLQQGLLSYLTVQYGRRNIPVNMKWVQFWICFERN
jgi:hypothetical protein